MANARKAKTQTIYPEGTVFGDWFITTELGTYVVKRMVDRPNGERSAQRAPRTSYGQYIKAYSERELDSQAKNPGEEQKPPRALEDFVIRLNGRDPKVERLKVQVRFGRAWINDEFLQTYRQDVLYSSIQDRTNADVCIGQSVVASSESSAQGRLNAIKGAAGILDYKPTV